MIRRVTIASEEKAMSVFRSMILVNIMTQCAIMEYHNEVIDKDFKSGTVHMKLKTAYDNLIYARNHVKNNFLKIDPDLEEEVEMETVILHEIMQKLIKLDTVNLQQLLDNLTEAITDAKTFKEANS